MERTLTASTRGTPSDHKVRSLTRLLVLGVCVLLAPSAAPAQQITVYRCIDAAGHVALQDQPCPPGREAARRTVQAEADSTPVATPALPTTPEETPPVLPEVVDAPAPPPPELWRCVDFDGKERYASRNEPNGRYVPLWVLSSGQGGPRGLAGRAGRPLPGFHGSTPAAPPGSAAAAPSPLVYVQDRCYRLPPDAACRHYRDQRSAIERRRLGRTGDERTQLDAESARLFEILRASCA